MKAKKIIFIYNANSGIANAMIDYGKKYLQPDEYDCELCMVTYGPFGMKQDWKRFVKGLGVEAQFLHRDEFEEIYPEEKVVYPAILAVEGQELSVLLSADDFKGISSLDELKQAVDRSLGE